MEQEVILQREDGMAILTLNRPQRLNALTHKMLAEEIPRLMEEVKGDEGIKALVLTGAGEAFCSGADIPELNALLAAEATEAAQMAAFNQLTNSVISSFFNMDKPIIAAINGIAAGGGFSLALLCDIRLASDKARFSMAFVRRGLIPDLGATYTLPRLVGQGRALEIMLTGNIFSAQEAERIGIVNKVIPHHELMTTAKDLAKELAKGPRVAVGLIKKSIYKSLDNTLSQQLEVESISQTLCARTEDFKEGVRSFIEKREPLFKGR